MFCYFLAFFETVGFDTIMCHNLNSVFEVPDVIVVRDDGTGARVTGDARGTRATATAPSSVAPAARPQAASREDAEEFSA